MALHIYPVDFDNDDESSAALHLAAADGSDAFRVWLRRVPSDVSNVWVWEWWDAWWVAVYTGPGALPHDGRVRRPVCDDESCDREAVRVTFDSGNEDPWLWCDAHGTVS